MRNSFLLIVLFIFFANISLAQDNDDDKKFSFSFNYGNSYPLGDFHTAAPSKLPLSKFTGQDTTRVNGYALRGFHYDLYITYKIVHHISIMISIAGDDNDIDINTLNQDYTKIFPQNTGITTGEYYSTMQYLAGPYFSIPVNENLKIECKVLVGLTTLTPPGLVYDSANVYRLEKGSGFGYNIGVGVKYITADGYMGLHLNVNYAGASIIFPNYSITNNSGGNFTAFTYNVPKSIPLSILQVTFGLSLEL